MYNMTAVEWVFDKMLDIAAGNSSLTTQEILEKGREMEREQMENSYWNGYHNDVDDFGYYYEQTYKGGEQ